MTDCAYCKEAIKPNDAQIQHSVDGALLHHRCLPKYYPGIEELRKKVIPIATLNSIPNHSIQEILGVVRGSTVLSRNKVSEFGPFMQTEVDGEIKEATLFLADAREQAMARMAQEAKELGADAVVEMRLCTSPIWGPAVEVMAYGTAVKIKPCTNLEIYPSELSDKSAY